MREAMFYQPEGAGVRCQLCPHGCVLTTQQAGRCRVRYHQDGRLYTANFGLCTSVGIDPMEKKPLYHFYPGEHILSVGTKGCNLKCQHCQNWSIAHGEPSVYQLMPEDLVELVCKPRTDVQSIGIAYTYSEPSVWYEYVLSTAQLAQRAGLKNVLVTNAFINQEPLLQLVPFIDAMNIDIKGFTEEFYRKVCGGGLAQVLEATRLAAQHCHVEITTLVIPGLNDASEEIAQLSCWVADNLGKEVPLHLSRYFPNYQLEYPPTPLETLQRSKEIAQGYLKYVYVGNVPGEDNNTHCPKCGIIVIRRGELGVELVGLTESNTCKQCGQEIPIIR